MKRCKTCSHKTEYPYPLCIPGSQSLDVKLFKYFSERNKKDIFMIKGCSAYKKKKKKKNWLEQLIQNFVSTKYFNKNNKQKSYVKQHSYLYCLIMNIVDVRFWFCKCRYFDPYGKVIYAGCKRHD